MANLRLDQWSGRPGGGIPAAFPQQALRQLAKRSEPLPVSQLPATWESYLTECLGTKTGKCLRRSLRAIEERGEYRLTQADGANLEPHLEALLSKWHSRWGLPDYYKEGFRQVMRQAHFQGTLSLHCIWDGDKLIGSTSGFLEPERKAFTACLTSSDRSYTNDPGQGGLPLQHPIRHRAGLPDL